MTASRPAAVVSTAAARAFSRAAAMYDAEHAANPLARWTRRRSLAALERAFAPDARLLELGCGAGAEALHLAARGASIVATDAAPGMIATLAAKLAPGGGAEDLAGRVTPLVLPAARVGELAGAYGPAAFDGAYSSFGPLNCEPDLAPVAAALAALVRPGGRVVLSLINRYCLWETAWYLRAGQPALAFRRWSGRATATVRAEWRDERIPVFYWTPGAVARAFAPYFGPRGAWACRGCCRPNTSTASRRARRACSVGWRGGTGGWPAPGPATPLAITSDRVCPRRGWAGAVSAAGAPSGGRLLLRRGGVLLLSNTAGQGLAFLTSIAVARLLGVERFGEYAAVMALVFLLGIVADTGIELSLSREWRAIPGRAARCCWRRCALAGSPAA